MTMERGLSCQEFVELVTDYLEGSLPPEERRRFEEHLERCPGCDTYLAQIRDTAATAGRVEEEHLTEPARTRLLDAFRTWKGD